MPDLDPSIEDPQLDDEPRGLRRQIEEQATGRKAAEDRAAAAERELAFAKAGLPLSDPKMDYFVKGYDGELTPEAIKAAAEAAGFLEPPKQEVPPEELRQHQQAAQLAAGTQGNEVFSGPLDQNPQYQAEMAQARSVQEAAAVMTKFGSPILIDD